MSGLPINWADGLRALAIDKQVAVGYYPTIAKGRVVEKASITLTDTHHQLLHAAVEAGEYTTVSEAIRDALRDWEHKRKAREAEVELLREMLAEGLEDFRAGRFHAWDPEATKARILGKL